MFHISYSAVLELRCEFYYTRVFNSSLRLPIKFLITLTKLIQKVKVKFDQITIAFSFDEDDTKLFG